MSQLEKLQKDYRALLHRFAQLYALVTGRVQLPPGGLLNTLRTELAARGPDARCPCCLRSPVATNTWNQLTVQDEMIKELRERIAELETA